MKVLFLPIYLPNCSNSINNCLCRFLNILVTIRFYFYSHILRTNRLVDRAVYDFH